MQKAAARATASGGEVASSKSSATRPIGCSNSSMVPGASTLAARSASASRAAVSTPWPASAAAWRSQAGPPITATARVRASAPAIQKHVLKEQLAAF